MRRIFLWLEPILWERTWTRRVPSVNYGLLIVPTMRVCFFRNIEPLRGVIGPQERGVFNRPLISLFQELTATGATLRWTMVTSAWGLAALGTRRQTLL